jgi:hypothetical protein
MIWDCGRTGGLDLDPTGIRALRGIFIVNPSMCARLAKTLNFAFLSSWGVGRCFSRRRGGKFNPRAETTRISSCGRVCTTDGKFTGIRKSNIWNVRSGGCAVLFCPGRSGVFSTRAGFGRPFPLWTEAFWIFSGGSHCHSKNQGTACGGDRVRSDCGPAQPGIGSFAFGKTLARPGGQQDITRADNRKLNGRLRQLCSSSLLAHNMERTA